MTALNLAPNLAAWLAVLGFAGPLLAETAEPTKIEAFPPAISLNGANDRQSLVVQATFADGLTRDVTREATLTPANPALFRREGTTFLPVADGETELTVSYEGHSARVP